MTSVTPGSSATSDGGHEAFLADIAQTIDTIHRELARVWRGHCPWAAITPMESTLLRHEVEAMVGLTCPGAHDGAILRARLALADRLRELITDTVRETPAPFQLIVRRTLDRFERDLEIVIVDLIVGAYRQSLRDSVRAEGHR